MADTPKTALCDVINTEPYARKMGIVCNRAGEGEAELAMTVTQDMANIFGICHGGAIFGLMDDAFQIACNSRGIAAFALNVSITYIAGAEIGDRLTATAREASLTPRVGTYQLEVVNQKGTTVATAHAIAYRKKAPPPFAQKDSASS